MSSCERSGWRDKRLSDLHRKWGMNCPMCDIDWLVSEYDTRRTVAILEYKHQLAKEEDFSDPNYETIINLGNDCGRPVFSVRYSDDLWHYKVSPLNTLAKKHFREPTVMDQVQYVSFLYYLRNREIPTEILNEIEERNPHP